MIDDASEDELTTLPLFAGIDGVPWSTLRHATTAQHERGSYIFRRGDPGDALYVVVAGQVATELGGRLLCLCGPGDWFGEMALLGSGDRCADAKVTVDATLLRIDREQWALLGAHAPNVFMRICERLASQLRRQNEPLAAMRRRVVACIDAQRWLRPLLDSVRRQFPARDVFVIDTVGKDVTADPDRAVLNGSDRVRASESVARLVERDALILLAATRGETTSIGEHVLLRDSPLTWSIEGSGGTKELRGRTEDEAVDRIARWLMMGSVGLALGAGGAYGFAHFGLLHVLEEAGIPIDVVTGTSMGSIAAATVATGIPSRRTIDHIHRVATRYRSIVMRDLDWWGRTLLTGAGVRRILEELDELRRATFETLLIPFEAVAMDVGNGTEVAISSGSVLDAIQASIAMPGIFPTCRRGERHLVDGAMVNPVPVDRARALGADVVVAVQPIPPLQEPRADHARSNIFNRIPLGPLRGGMDSLGTSIRSFQSLWYKLASAAALTGDIAVAPDLRAFWFLQFGAAPQLIEAGERHARQLLPEIRAALAARTGLVA